jgi:hypothetical protein
VKWQNGEREERENGDSDTYDETGFVKMKKI